MLLMLVEGLKLSPLEMKGPLWGKPRPTEELSDSYQRQHWSWSLSLNCLTGSSQEQHSSREHAICDDHRWATTYKAIPIRIKMCQQQNSQISSAAARRDRILWHGRLADFSLDEASWYDLIVRELIEGHYPCSKFTTCPLLSLLLSHTGGGKTRKAGYRCFSRFVGRNAHP